MDEMKKLTMNEFLEQMKQKGYNTFTRMPCGCDKANGELYDMTREIQELKCPTMQCPGILKHAVIIEDGMSFDINRCTKCGYWCDA